ncbi:MAG: Clp protease N-terminal domain-containing protein [Cyanobacteria bacterium J06598_1]
MLSLRELGLSLSEIRDCLERPDYSLPQVIDLHRDRLREKISQSHMLLNRLNGIAKELEANQSVAVENLIQTMETMTMTMQYFTTEQQETIEHRLRASEEAWQAILTDEAKQQEKSQISPEHLLLAMLEEYKEAPAPGGVATYILRTELHIDLQQLEQQLRRAISE